MKSRVNKLRLSWLTTHTQPTVETKTKWLQEVTEVNTSEQENSNLKPHTFINSVSSTDETQKQEIERVSSNSSFHSNSSYTSQSQMNWFVEGGRGVYKSSDGFQGDRYEELHGQGSQLLSLERQRNSSNQLRETSMSDSEMLVEEYDGVEYFPTRETEETELAVEDQPLKPLKTHLSDLKVESKDESTFSTFAEVSEKENETLNQVPSNASRSKMNMLSLRPRRRKRKSDKASEKLRTGSASHLSSKPQHFNFHHTKSSPDLRRISSDKSSSREIEVKEVSGSMRGSSQSTGAQAVNHQAEAVSDSRFPVSEVKFYSLKARNRFTDVHTWKKVFEPKSKETNRRSGGSLSFKRSKDDSEFSNPATLSSPVQNKSERWFIKRFLFYARPKIEYKIICAVLENLSKLLTLLEEETKKHQEQGLSLLLNALNAYILTWRFGVATNAQNRAKFKPFGGKKSLVSKLSAGTFAEHQPRNALFEQEKQLKRHTSLETDTRSLKTDEEEIKKKRHSVTTTVPELTQEKSKARMSTIGLQFLPSASTGLETTMNVLQNIKLSDHDLRRSRAAFEKSSRKNKKKFSKISFLQTEALDRMYLGLVLIILEAKHSVGSDNLDIPLLLSMISNKLERRLFDFIEDNEKTISQTVESLLTLNEFLFDSSMKSWFLFHSLKKLMVKHWADLTNYLKLAISTSLRLLLEEYLSKYLRTVNSKYEKLLKREWILVGDYVKFDERDVANKKLLAENLDFLYIQMEYSIASMSKSMMKMLEQLIIS